MENFATYILNEQNYIQKMIIAHYMSKKTGIFFNKSIILRTELARMFLNYANLDVDKNEVLTEILLCNCKKVDNPQKIGKLETYAKEGAEYLSTLGFSKKFCKVCEGLNRYSIEEKDREKESDILEVIDQFAGLILRRPEREAFTPEEAIIILKERNLKHVYNRYLEDFILFVQSMEKLYIKDTVEVPVIKKLAFLTEKENDVKSFISDLGNRYSEEIDRLMNVNEKEQIEEILYNEDNGNIKKNAIEKVTEKAKKAKTTVTNAHRYTRTIEKKNKEQDFKQGENALFSKEVASRVMNHESIYKIEELEERI